MTQEMYNRIQEIDYNKRLAESMRTPSLDDELLSTYRVKIQFNGDTAHIKPVKRYPNPMLDPVTMDEYDVSAEKAKEIILACGGADIIP